MRAGSTHYCGGCHRHRGTGNSLIMKRIITLALVVATGWPLAAIAQSDPVPTAPPTMVTLSTGSRVATWTVPATATQQRKTPVLFLHGGPGMYTTEGARSKGAPLRAAGFKTIYFDQAGGGRSDRLPATQYSLQRAVDDVEALRVSMKADKIVLWGSSYGAALASLYVRRYPDRIAGLILSSPGGFPGTTPKRSYGLTNRGSVTMSAALSKALGQVDGKGAAAEALISQEAAGKLMDELVASELLGGMVCKGTRITPIVNGGGNLFPNRILGKQLKSTPLAEGAPLGRPVLILRGSCDFLGPENAERYRAAFGGTITTIPGTGHQFVENRAALDAALTDFATKQLAGVE
jgi:pimeloyl-ACP methyl ester carboxylesterase